MDRKRRLMENNNGWPLRSQLFDGAPFRLPLLSTAVPASAATGTTATFTRATTKTWPNNDGYQVTGLAGEIGFVGARRVRNLVTTTSEDFSNAAWTKTNTTVIANQTAAPNGTLTADLLYPTTTGTLRFTSQTILGVSLVGTTVLVISVYAKSAGMSWMYLGLPGTGSTQGAYFNLSTGAIGTIKAGASNVTMTAVGNGWYRCSLTQLDPADTAAYPVISVADADNSTTATTNGTDGIYIWGAQLEDVSAQTTQTAGEYVSVGALDYRSELNRLYLSLPGTASHDASSPDKAAPLGDMTVVFHGAATDWTPAAPQYIVSKHGGAGQLGIQFYISATVPQLAWSPEGSSIVNVAATAGVPFSDGNAGYVAATLDVNNGAGGYSVNFYTSTDGSTWTQLGATVSGAGITAQFNNTAAFSVGGYAGGTGTRFVGKVFSAQVYDGIPPMLGGSDSATPAVDFNPHRDATTPTGTITSSTTGEVWTINGASSVVRSDYYHGSMVDGVKCFPTDLSGNPIPLTTLLGYQAQGARTNLCLQSNAFDNASWTKAAVSVVADQYTAPDGATTADKVLVSAGNAQHYIYLTPLSITAATYSVSFYCKYINHRWIAIDLVDSVGHLYASFDLLNGVTGAVSGGVTSSIESVGNGFYRISWTAARALRADATVYLIFNNSNTASFETWNAVGTEAVGVWGAQVELGSFASSYIPTTTIAVARNADSLTYTGGDIPNLKTLMAGFRREVGVSSAGVIAALSTGFELNSALARLSNATASRFDVVAAGVAQVAAVTSNAYIPGTRSSVAMSLVTDNTRMSKDGVAQTADTSCTIPSTTRVEIGMVQSGEQLNGNVGPIYGWTRNLSQSELNAVSV